MLFLILLAQTVLAVQSTAHNGDMPLSSSYLSATRRSFLARLQASPLQPSQVPNPNTQPAKCKIPGPGGLCDPDGVLTPQGRIKILDALTAIRQKTNLTCPDGKEHGYQMAVLVVQQMDLSSGPLKGLSIVEAAKTFAKDIGNMWGVGDKGCDNGIVMFLSIQDRVAYIKTTDTTQKALSDSDATLVVENMYPLLREERYDEAVLQGTLQVYDVLMGKSIEPHLTLVGVIFLVSFFSIWCGGFLMILLPCLPIALCGCLYVVLVAVLCLPMAFIADALTPCCHRRKQISQDEQEQAQQDLQRVAKELERNEFDQTICPICLDQLKGEDDQETKTLQCKHKYHKQCVEEWLVQHRNCPLCRSDVSDVSLADEDAKQPESYQRRLRFYLSRVQANNRSVFGSSNTSYGAVNRPSMYQRNARTGRIDVSDYYLYGYAYPFGYGYGHGSDYNASSSYVNSLNTHLASAQSGAMTWAQTAQSAPWSSGGGGGGGGHSSGFGGGGGFSGGGGGGGRW